MAKRKQKGKCLVYGIWDENDNLRYIGQTQSTLEKRMKYHKRSAFMYDGYFGEWLRTELKAKRKVEIGVLDDNATWDVSEVLWIERKRIEGCDLFNVTRGGADTLANCEREGVLPKAYTEWKAGRGVARLKEADRLAEVYAKALRLGIDPVQPIPS